ncbi:hypothetical protein NA57DRAFT_52638 [Rhizodiscina lignyota]|uniref:Uncharacterized protein n=1 Tax=Rhizodiscina lignyota TaxID=1504668 RepID=A0A9P4IPN1_9PEZI|nr:hypothetical protein NA57DRAFT_52638 [Rhizodiscina lignyota]
MTVEEVIMADAAKEGASSTEVSILSLCKDLSPEQLTEIIAKLQDIKAKDTSQASTQKPSLKTGGAASNTISSDRHSLLTLHAEIRSSIYRELLIPIEKVIWFPQYGGDLIDISILCTCRQVHQEATELLYSEAALYVEAWYEPAEASTTTKSELDNAEESEVYKSLTLAEEAPDTELKSDSWSKQNEALENSEPTVAIDKNEINPDPIITQDNDAMIARVAMLLPGKRTTGHVAAMSGIMARFRELRLCFLASANFPNEGEYTAFFQYSRYLWGRHYPGKEKGYGMLKVMLLWQPTFQHKVGLTKDLARQIACWRKVDAASSSLMWSLKELCTSGLGTKVVLTPLAHNVPDGDEQVDMYLVDGGSQGDLQAQTWAPDEPLPPWGIRCRFGEHAFLLEDEVIGKDDDESEDDGIQEDEDDSKEDADGEEY